jgi:chromosome segregation ATPase
MSKPINVEA